MSEAIARAPNYLALEESLRAGISVEKGVTLTTDFMEKNEELIKKYCEFWRLYPDVFVETIKSKTCPITLFTYQRLFLRAAMRYKYHYATYTRAYSKSWLAIFSLYLRCMFLPNSKVFVVSEYKSSSLKITKQKLDELWQWYPLLKAELLDWHMSNDYIDLFFKNGSYLTIVSMSAASRGQRACAGIVEEAALINGDTLNEVILPMMNIARRAVDGRVIQGEPHACQTWVTSAGAKTSFAYEKLIEFCVNECIDPDDYYVHGGDYRVPVHYGLLDKKFIDDQRLSPNYSEQTFAQEYMSIWSGAERDSWFDNNKIIRCRTLLQAERKEKTSKNKDYFYIFGIDVARYGNNDTAIIILKVFPNDNAWKKNVVYIENLTKVSLPLQALRIKELARIYNPREIVIDGNGVGAGLIDEMVLPSLNAKTGEVLPPIYVHNDEDYPIPRGRDSEALIYNIKANAALNSEIFSNIYVQINSGNVKFLASERVVREKLMATKKGQKMSLYNREVFLLPYIMTSRLVDELNNLKLKTGSASGQIAVEQISRRINKDRFSALAYGLYRIKYFEDETLRKHKHKKTSLAAFLQMSRGNE